MARVYTMATRATRTQQTRAAVLDAFRALLAERPFAAVTMEAVAARAGVALRTAYYHFPARTTVLAALLERLSDDMRGLEQLPDAPTQAERVRLHVGLIFGVWQKWGDLLWMAIRQGEDAPELAETLRRYYLTLRTALETAYADMLDAAPDLQTGRHRLALLVGLLDVPMWHHLTAVQSLQPADAADAVAEMIVSYH